MLDDAAYSASPELDQIFVINDNKESTILGENEPTAENGLWFPSPKNGVEASLCEIPMSPN